MDKKTEKIVNFLIENDLYRVTNTGAVLIAPKSEMEKLDIPEDIREEVLRLGI